MGTKQKTDPYAAFLGVAALVLVAGGVFTWNQYGAMQAAERRQKFAEDWWNQSKKLEAEIHTFPQDAASEQVGWDMSDVVDAIIGGDNPRVKEMLTKHNVKGPGGLMGQYHLNVNAQARQKGDVLGSWTYDSLPLDIKGCMVDDLGRFLSAIEILFPQVKTTRLAYTQQADKAEGNATVQLTMYIPKEK